MPIERDANKAANAPNAMLRRFLQPATIAVAGGLEAAEVIRQCRHIGFAGELWAIHPHREAIEGVRCVRSAAELPRAPDACFLAIPAAAMPSLVADLRQRGAGGVVVYASGFAEVGTGGAAAQQALIEAAGDMPLLGPNCYGLINYLDGVALWPDRQGGERLAQGERGVAILTQSGNIALNLTMQRRHLPIAVMAALGNAAGLHFHDLIDALADDPRVSAIGLHIEGLSDVPAFAAAAQASLKRGVPIVALKTGASQRGALLAASHTSALAGPDVLYDALFDRAGIARVHDLDKFIETLKLLHTCGPLPGRRVSALSCSGGEASLVADLGEAAGLEFPPLGAAAEARLSDALGPKVSLSNPLDYHTYIWADVPALQACFMAMSAVPVDVAMLVIDFPFHQGERPEGWQEAIDAFIAARAGQHGAAMVVSSLAELMPAEQAKRLLAVGIAPMQGLGQALRAVRSAAAIGSMCRRMTEDPMAPLFAPALLREGEKRQLNEWDAKQALAGFGLQVPRGRVADNETEAVFAAEVVGYPVVMKALSETLAHKTEHGAVKLGLRDAAQVKEAARALAVAGYRQWLVEAMVTDEVAELIVGVKRDQQFGLALTIGAGGVWVELLRDSVTLLLPVSDQSIEQALRRLRCHPLLDGYRGRPRADIPAIIEAVAAVARFAVANADWLIELDVNPLIATAIGAVAVDALIVKTI